MKRMCKWKKNATTIIITFAIHARRVKRFAANKCAPRKCVRDSGYVCGARVNVWYASVLMCVLSSRTSFTRCAFHLRIRVCVEVMSSPFAEESMCVCVCSVCVGRRVVSHMRDILLSAARVQTRRHTATLLDGSHWRPRLVEFRTSRIANRVMSSVCSSQFVL